MTLVGRGLLWRDGVVGQDADFEREKVSLVADLSWHASSGRFRVQIVVPPS